MNLAYKLGATKIVLLGYDMTNTGGKAHWFGNHPTHYPEGHRLHGKTRNNATRMGVNQDPARFIYDFDTLRDAPVEIVNASRHTKLDMFPRVALEDAYTT